MLVEQYLYQEAQKAVNERVRGLPNFCRLVIFQSLQYCDLETGKILLPSLEEMAARDFYVSAAPGRKREEIKGDVLRNAIRTIKKCASEHFIFSQKNQRIEIELPFLRQLYEKSLRKEEQGTGHRVEEKKGELIENDNKNIDSMKKTSLENEREEAPASLPINNIKNINIFNKNNNNNSSHFSSKNFKSGENAWKLSEAECVDLSDAFEPKVITPSAEPQGQKSEVPDNFYPSETVVKLAQSRGYKGILDRIEIQKFIEFNKAIGSRWADYNFVYLKWLAKREVIEARDMAKVANGGFYSGRTESHFETNVSRLNTQRALRPKSKEAMQEETTNEKKNNVVSITIKDKEDVMSQKPKLIRVDALIEERLTDNQIERVQSVIKGLTKEIIIDDLKALEEEIHHCLLSNQHFKACGKDFGRKLNAIRQVILRGDWQRPVSMLEKEKQDKENLIEPIHSKLKEAHQDLSHYERMSALSKAKGFHDSSIDETIKACKAKITQLEQQLKHALAKLKNNEPMINN